MAFTKADAKSLATKLSEAETLVLKIYRKLAPSSEVDPAVIDGFISKGFIRRDRDVISNREVFVLTFKGGKLADQVAELHRNSVPPSPAAPPEFTLPL